MSLVEQAKGRLKQVAGVLLGNRRMQVEGEEQEAKGEARQEASEARTAADVMKARARAKDADADHHESRQRRAQDPPG